MSNQYIYVLIRKDLPAAQRVVQVAHAVINLAQETKFNIHPSVIILGVNDQASLIKEANRVTSLGLKDYRFNEPLFNNELTSVAFLTNTDEERKIFKKYQLLSNESFLSNHDQKLLKIQRCQHSKTRLDYNETFAHEFTPMKVCSFCNKEVSRNLNDEEKRKLYILWHKDILERTPSEDEIRKNKNGFNI